MNNKRKKYRPEFKPKVALSALKNDETTAAGPTFRGSFHHDRIMEAVPEASGADMSV